MKKQTPKTKRLTEAKRKHLKTVKRKQLSEIKKSLKKFQRLNENKGRELDVVSTDNRDSTYTVLRLSNGDYVEVNVLELYQNLLDNQDEE